MIKDSQKTKMMSLNDFSPTTQRSWPVLRARPLQAIEIAEGALLADIGVLFQILIKFLPVGGAFLLLLVPVVFSVIVLRRGFYVGCMSLCVALFVICIVMGPGGVPFLFLGAGAGLFLGLVMRYRLGHFVTFVVGILGGGAALWMVLLFYTFVGGGLNVLLRTMHQTYASLTAVLGLLFTFVRLGGLWHQQLLPVLDRFMQWSFQNWLFLYYLSSCLLCIPLVFCVYFVVNFFLRMLGYQVRPFPGHRVEGWLLALAKGLFWLVPRKVLARVPAFYRLKCEVRRLNIARLRRYRLEKEARKAL